MGWAGATCFLWMLKSVGCRESRGGGRMAGETCAWECHVLKDPLYSSWGWRHALPAGSWPIFQWAVAVKAFLWTWHHFGASGMALLLLKRYLELWGKRSVLRRAQMEGDTSLAVAMQLSDGSLCMVVSLCIYLLVTVVKMVWLLLSHVGKKTGCFLVAWLWNGTVKERETFFVHGNPFLSEISERRDLERLCLSWQHTASLRLGGEIMSIILF